MGLEPYYKDDLVTLYHGDCREILPPIKGINAVVTDPPYELGFMGKGWDKQEVSFQLETWQLIRESCLPGAMLLSFGGTRTSHRIACAIEDAGWQIRDTIMWVYGSGFPKSLDISKAIDKQKGAKREVIGESNRHGGGSSDIFPERGNTPVTTPATPEAKLWEGYGTALKPAYENIIVAQRPLTAAPFYDIMMVVVKQIGGQICQLPSFARIVASHSASSQHELNGELDIAQWLVDNNTNTLGILSVLTDTVQLELETNTNWNIVLLWLNILTDLYKMMSRFTISTETALIIELKILQSLAWQDIFQNITHLQDNQTNGLNANALTAVNLFSAIGAKLNYILTYSAQETAIFKDAFSDLRPNYEPIILAMKPLDGTFANNALKYKVAGLNIDECRVKALKEDRFGGGGLNSPHRGLMSNTKNTYQKGTGFRDDTKKGRFPANFIHDGSQEVMELFPDTKKGSSSGYNFDEGNQDNPSHLIKNIKSGVHFGDKGSAARFFYAAKASRRERDAGLEDMPLVKVNKMGSYGNQADFDCPDGAHRVGDKGSAQLRNNHPTVKPLALMTYLCKLVKMPEYNLILDPFCGSGSTLLACKKLGIPCIGIDSNEEYCELASKRINAIMRYSPSVSSKTNPAFSEALHK